MTTIDALRPGRPNKHGKRNEPSKFIGGFGVFDPSSSLGVPEEIISPGRDQNFDLCGYGISPLPIQPENGEISESSPTAPDTTAHGIPLADPTNLMELNTVDGSFNDNYRPHSFDGSEDSLEIDQFDGFETFEIEGLDDRQEVEHSNWQLDLTCAIPRSLSAEYLTSNERFLMNYYSNRVVHLFAVLDSPKSPWKTVHLPRVLQSTGEMALQGSTSQIRAALRHSLLSISAFYMSKHVRCQSKIEESGKWNREAMRFHGVAMKLLKDAVNAGSIDPVRPKYKEFLATMLSMISINVSLLSFKLHLPCLLICLDPQIMSGNTGSCGLHLDAAYRLITETGKQKKRYSSKAQALHRVYFYLRTIYESTAIHDSSSPARSPDATTPLSSTVENSPHEDFFASAQNANFDSAQRNGAYENIYAIPVSLLLYLSRATQLVNEVLATRNQSGDAHIPSYLAQKCDDLETEIMDWQAEDISPSKLSNPEPNLGIIHNMTRAFHQAIVIYFAQHIRLLGHRYLKPFVENVIESIEAVERIKVEWQILASPLYWPAFIAASEAFDTRLQDRFKCWYAQVESYAIGSMDPGIRLLQEVWEMGPTNCGPDSCLWRQIASRTKTTLMLT